MKSYEFNKKVKIRKEYNDKFLVYVPKYRNLLIVNATGYEILFHLKQGLSKEEIISYMPSKYNVELSVLEKDINRFLNKCKELYIIYET